MAEQIGAGLESIMQHRANLPPAPGFCSLGSGLAGAALYYAYLDKARPERGYDEKAIEYLERALGGLNEDPAPGTLFAGFPGVAWCLEHLQKMFLSEDEMDDPGGDAAVAIRNHLISASSTDAWGLVDGLAGLGVYALERLPRALGKECLGLVLSRLVQGSESCGPGSAWRTPPSQLLSHVRSQYPEGNFNLGMALGTPGIIAFLGEIHAAGIDDQGLLRRAVAWLLEQKLPVGAESTFPYTVAASSRPSGRQLAWCYGDLGIAVSLLGSARRLGEPSWEKEALKIANLAARRPIGEVRAVDGCLCHGTAGLLHLFNRIYQATSDRRFQFAAVAWLDQTVAFSAEGRGVGGFQSWHIVAGERGQWVDDPGFLTGAVGIGLTLLAAVAEVEPAWDRLLLATIPGDLLPRE